MKNPVPGPGAPVATIYGRRSTDRQEDSVPRQVENATRFIQERGWRLSETLYLELKGASRVEFKRRGALTALLDAAKRKPRPFDVVVIRDETRLGGDMNRTGLILLELHEAGVEIYHYITGERVNVEKAVDRFLVAARNFSSEMEREKCSDRSYEAAVQRFEKGYVAGGKIYGYDNVPAPDGTKHKVRAINEQEVEVVREIWRWYAEGAGQRLIAVRLNERGVAAPRAGRRGTSSWAPSCIRAILTRKLYCGVEEFNRAQKVVRGGTRTRQDRPAAELMQLDVPHLRIIPEDVEEQVAQRFLANEGTGASYQRSEGKYRYPLSGHARCGVCGGPIAIESNWGPVRRKLYTCGWRRDRGAKVCPNTVRRPVETVHETLFGLLEEEVLREELVGRVVAGLRQQMLTPGNQREKEATEIREALRKVQAETRNLLAMSATADDVEVQQDLLKELRLRKARERELLARQEALTAAPQAMARELGRLEEEITRRMAGFREELRKDEQGARKVLAAVLDGPIRVTPLGEGLNGHFQLEVAVKTPESVYCTTYGVPNGI